MIPSIGIKNYRSLFNLQIQSLGRVNLIIGKNNTGKSSLLEAISIYINNADLNWIFTLLQERGEHYKNSTNINNIESNLKSFSSLFFGREISFFNEDHEIEIGLLESNLFGVQISSDSVIIRLVKYVEEVIKQPDSENKDRIITRRKKIILDEKDETLFAESTIGIELKSSDFYVIIPIETERNYRIFNYSQSKPIDNIQFIRTRNIESELNGRLWDNIALSRKEEFVIRALKIIEPKIERLTFINNNTAGRQERIPVVKLENELNIIPLKSMGDGINRILTIILALTNSDNGYLLIDEFENGLHYTVQEKLWNIIFDLSNQLNVQVFATSHSLDSIKSFEKIINNQVKIEDGKLIRLDNINGLIKPVEYNADELKIATNQDIETR